MNGTEILLVLGVVLLSGFFSIKTYQLLQRSYDNMGILTMTTVMAITQGKGIPKILLEIGAVLPFMWVFALIDYISTLKSKEKGPVKQNKRADKGFDVFDVLK